MIACLFSRFCALSSYRGWLFGLILLAFAPCYAEGELIALGEFINASDSTSGKTWKPSAPWANAFAKACKARVSGIGMAPPESSGGQSGMTWSVEEGLTMAELHITCILTSNSAPKAQLLGVQLNADAMQEFPITFDDVNSPLTVKLTFQTSIIRTLTLTNETRSGTSLFEVQSVSYRATPEPISVSPAIPDIVFCGETLHCGLEEICGGSESYIAAVWSFNGEEYILSTEELYDVVTFTAPMTDGIQTLTLMVEDSDGTCEAFTYPIEVRPYSRAINLSASAISKTGFDLSWQLPAGGDPSYFRIQICPHEETGILTQKLTPTWEEVDAEEKTWEMQGVLPIVQWCGGRMCTGAYLRTDGWEGSASVRDIDEETWSSTLVMSSRILLPVDGKSLSLRVTSETPPEAVTVYLTVDPWVVDEVIPTGSGNRFATVTGLSAGQTYDVYVATTYTRDDGSTLTRRSAPLTVSTEAIPSFTGYTVDKDFPTFSLTWDERVESLPAQITFWAETEAEHALPGGLYLSRIYLTGADESTVLPRSKAIVLTNTSAAPIALEGAYTLCAQRERTEAERNDGKTDPVTTTWDFSVTVEGKKTYPHVVPAEGELLIFAQRYTLPETSVVTTTASALAYLTPAYTLTLLREDTAINTLTPQLNATVRLDADTLERYQSHPVNDTTVLPENLTTPWITLRETKQCSTQTRYANYGTCSVYYAPYMPPKETLFRFWATAYIFDESGTSTPITIPLYTRSTGGGYLFRLR